MALVVLPTDSKNHDSIRLCHPFEDLRVLNLLVIEDVRHERLDYLLHRLVELRLSRIPLDQSMHESFDMIDGRACHGPPCHFLDTYEPTNIREICINLDHRGDRTRDGEQ